MLRYVLGCDGECIRVCAYVRMRVCVHACMSALATVLYVVVSVRGCVWLYLCVVVCVWLFVGMCVCALARKIAFAPACVCAGLRHLRGVTKRACV